MKIIDAHVHIQPWEMLKPGALELMKRSRDAQRVMEIMESPQKFVELLDREGIERVVSINYPSPDIMGFTTEVHRYAAQFAKACDGRIIPVGSVHPLLTKDPVRDVADLVSLGFRGLKVHPPHQGYFPNQYRSGLKALELVYREAEQAGLVVYVHTGTSIFPGARNVYADPLTVDDVAVDFPRLRIVLAHGGRPLWMETCFFLVRRHPRMYMDISSVPPKKVLEFFPRLEEISDRVLFGSDWPAPGVPGMRANAEAFAALPLDPRSAEAILHRNCDALFPTA
jgi:predicted TIM-barrel fold metal-dependent hydrolase